MKRYLLRYVLHGPSDDYGGMYMAEIPVLPGCQAWGDTPEETIDILTSVAEQFLASYKEHGDKLPQGVEDSELQQEPVDSYKGSGDKFDASRPDFEPGVESILVTA